MYTNILTNHVSRPSRALKASTTSSSVRVVTAESTKIPVTTCGDDNGHLGMVVSIYGEYMVNLWIVNG